MNVLNVKGKAKFALAIQDTDDWKPFSINDKPVSFLEKVIIQLQETCVLVHWFTLGIFGYFGHASATNS